MSNLLSVLSNASLVLELRRSAAEQLLTLAAQPRLLDTLAAPDALRELVRQAAPGVATNGAGEWPALCSARYKSRPDSRCTAAYRDLRRELSVSWLHKVVNHRFSPYSILIAEAMDLAAAMSVFEQQLPVACLQLLFTLAARSRAVRGWFLANPTARLVPLLPLAFHGLASVRGALARLLAALLVLPAAEAATGYASAYDHALSASGPLPLPRPFCEALALPFAAQPIDLKAPPLAAAALDGELHAVLLQQLWNC